MKKSVLTFTLAASVLALSACGSAEDETLVTSKVGDITVGEFNETAKSLAGPAVIQQMVTEKVLDDKYDVSDKEIQAKYDEFAKQYGESFKDILTQSGFTEETFKDTLPLQILQDKALKDQYIKEEDVKKYYEQMKTELNARHILVEDEETAKEAIAKIQGGAAFADVAKEYSTDPGSAEKGGELGWFSVGKMVDEFNDASYALELNTLSEPVQSQMGFHVIEVTEKRDVKDIKSYEKEEDNIRQLMVDKLNVSQQAPALVQEIVSKMVKKADFKTSDKLLKPALKAMVPAEEEKAEDTGKESKK
ncbi:MAG: peptidylprolyl isomerase [Lysinibacillus sp.]